MKRKVLSVWLALVLLLSVLTPAVSAQDPAVDFGTKQTQFNGHTYVLVDESMTWQQAKVYCEQKGGYLATITCEAEQQVVAELLADAAKYYYWLGATDEEKEGEWKWVTGEEFIYYGPARTFDNAYGGEDYLQMIATDFNGKLTQRGDWNDNNNESYIERESDIFRTELAGLICEFGTEPMPSEGSTTVTYMGHTYTAVDTSLTWKEAKKYCEYLGGYLATVTSQGEQEAIESAISGGKKDQYWLGGTDEKKEKNWQWVTGEPFSFWANLVSFDNAHGGEDYLQIQTNNFGNKAKFGFWNDVNNENYVKGEDDFYSLEHTGFILEKGTSEMPFENSKEPVIYIKGRTPIYNTQNKQAIKTDTSYITDVIEKNADLLVEAITLGRWKKYCDAIYTEIAERYQDYRLNNDGEVDNGSHIKYSWSESKLFPAQGDIFTYLFEYDGRLDPCVIADDLHEYIEAVKRVTGSDTVHIVARCLGCNIATAYLAQYGWEDLDTFVMYSSSAVGYGYISDIFSGNIKFDAESVDNYCEERLDSEDIEEDALREVVKATVNYARTHGLLSLNMLEGQLIFDAIAKNLMDRLVLATYGTCPGYWSMVNDERFEEAKKYLFGDEANTTYKKLIEKIDNYHYNVMNRTEEMLLKMQEDGVSIDLVCKYGFQMPPFVPSSRELSDDTIGVAAQSFGATCADTGRTLSKKYLRKAKANGTDRFISPDRQIDSSTALFPDQTWYVKNYDHSNFYDCFNDMLLDMCYYDGTMKVDSDERYPQYLFYDYDIDDFYPLTAETEEPYQHTNSFLASFVRLMKAILEFWISVFIFWK